MRIKSRAPQGRTQAKQHLKLFPIGIGMEESKEGLRAFVLRESLN